MKKFLIFKKNEDSTPGQKLHSYEAIEMDKGHGALPHPFSPEVSLHYELPEGMDADVVKPVLVEAVPGQAEKWTKEGEEDVFENPMDESWTYVPAVSEVPAHYELQVDATLLAAKQEYASKAGERAAMAALLKAKDFGNKVMNDFTAENILLGITQAGMTGTVRKAMGEVILALTTGSLYDAITEAKLIPAEKKDATFITDARLLSFVNKIEAYLGVPLSTTL